MFKIFKNFSLNIVNHGTILTTLQQEAEDIKQEKNTRTIQVSEEPFIVHDGEFMSRHIADNVRYTDDN